MDNINPDEFEKKYVADVYDEIAEHFDISRFARWTFVEKFLQTTINESQTSMIADIGCGNGKYMIGRENRMKGIDQCKQLVEICKKKNLDVIEGNIAQLPFKNNEFDHAICIAVIHHISTDEGRIRAIKEILRVIKPNGKALITVWSLKNDGEKDKKKQMIAENNIINKKQDALIPWTITDNINKQSKVINRYYHLFDEGEMEKLCELAGGNIIEETHYEKGNISVIMKKI